MMVRLFFLMTLLMPGLAIAQQRGIVPPPCFAKDWEEVRRWQEWIKQAPIEHEENWSKEAARIGQSADAWRSLDRLYLRLDDDGLVMLTDCPFTDNLYFYLYEGFDTAGRFHVVRTMYYEDVFFALVMKKTGALYNVPAPPVWSPNRTRFAYAVCSQLNDREEAAVMMPADDGLKLEVKTKIPCGVGDCELTWESDTALAVHCDEKKSARFALRGDRWAVTRGTGR